MAGQAAGINSGRPYETLAYMPQLDALRTFAVMGVFLTHFCSFESIWAQTPHWGRWGVQLFFVLSGFLITGILLKCRGQIESRGLSVRTGLWHFYGRRYLRLAPIYYLTLAVMVLINPVLWEYLWWYATYLQNFLFSWVGHSSATPEPALNHFWTLAVEEQFYLVWPFLILFTPRRWLVPAVVAVICSALPFKLLMFSLGAGMVSTRVLMPAQVELLGMGSLLAVLHHGSADGYARAERFVRVIFWPGLVLFAAYVVMRYLALRGGTDLPVGDRPALLVTGPASAMLFTWVIHRAAGGFGGAVGWVLTRRPLIYLGKISYGLYVYHNLVELVFERYALPGLGLPIPEHNLARFLLYSGGTILLSMASWHAIEYPLSRLKRYLRYQEPAARPGDATG